MANLNVLINLILLSLLLAYFSPSRADYPNYETGLSCSEWPDNSTTSAFKTNLNSLLSILEEEGPRNSGFYKTTTGEESDKIYGLVQCRGDVSAQDCATCIKDSINKTFTTCKNSKFGALWFRWCFLQYSKENFFGQWDGGSLGMTFDNTTTDGPAVVATGMSFMSQLTAEVPEHPFMFKTGSVSVGQKGKRYGLVQCNRDLSKSTCRDCLVFITRFFNQVVGNESSYLVISKGCRLWYDNYKFYFNYTLPASGFEPTSASHTGLEISLVTVTVAFLSLIIPRPMM